jgi:hypothetical protein
MDLKEMLVFARIVQAGGVVSSALMSNRTGNLLRGCVVVTVLAAVWAAGCTADECPAEATQCIGNVAETCFRVPDTEFTGHTELRREDCGARFCKVPPGSSERAFCALSDEVDAACPEELRARSHASRCLDNVLVEWRFGFRVRETPCSGGATCVDAAHPGFRSQDPDCKEASFCSPHDSVDPLCTPGVFTACADGETIVYCACGYVAEAHRCSSPGPACKLEPSGAGGPAQGVCR